MHKIKALVLTALVSSSFFVSISQTQASAIEVKSFINNNSNVIETKTTTNKNIKTPKDFSKYTVKTVFITNTSTVYEDEELKKEKAVVKSGSIANVYVKENGEFDNVSKIILDENLTGFIQKDHISKELIFENIDQKMSFKSKADIYEKPDISSKIISKAEIGNEIRVVGITDVWTKLQFKDKSIGYTKSNNILEKEDLVNIDNADNSDFSIKSSEQDIITNSNYTNSTTVQGSGTGVDIANFALKYVGGKYVWGGNILGVGVDCSGFTREVYKRFGVSIPRTSYAQRFIGKSVSREDAKPGDIVCFSGHVGMYIGNGKMVHASSPSTGIIVTSIDYGSKKVLDIRRVVE